MITRDNTNERKRQERLRYSKSKGTHTKTEWQEMKEFFNFTCCKCLGKSGLINVERDHIIPVYQGGSDHIRNLQPLCARCNSGKGSENIDYRGILARILKKKLPETYKNPY